MRHRNSGRKFGRNSSHRRAMLRNMAGALISHEKIQTTDAKANELRRVTERLLTMAVRLGEVACTREPAQLPSNHSATAREIVAGKEQDFRQRL